MQPSSELAPASLLALIDQLRPSCFHRRRRLPGCYCSADHYFIGRLPLRFQSTGQRCVIIVTSSTIVSAERRACSC